MRWFEPPAVGFRAERVDLLWRPVMPPVVTPSAMDCDADNRCPPAASHRVTNLDPFRTVESLEGSISKPLAHRIDHREIEIVGGIARPVLFPRQLEHSFSGACGHVHLDEIDLVLFDGRDGRREAIEFLLPRDGHPA